MFSATSCEARKQKHNATPEYWIRNTIETQKKYQTQMEREIQYEEEFPGVSMAWRNPKQRHRGRMKLARVLNGIERMQRIFLVWNLHSFWCGSSLRQESFPCTRLLDIRWGSKRDGHPSWIQIWSLILTLVVAIASIIIAGSPSLHPWWLRFYKSCRESVRNFVSVQIWKYCFN